MLGIPRNSQFHFARVFALSLSAIEEKMGVGSPERIEGQRWEKEERDVGVVKGLRGTRYTGNYGTMPYIKG